MTTDHESAPPHTKPTGLPGPGKSRWVKVLIGLLVIVGAGVFLVTQLPGRPFSTDLTRIGGGTPALVVARDSNYMAGADVMDLINLFRSHYEDRVEFLAVHMGHPDGQAFARRHQMQDATVILFNAAGEPLERWHGPQTAEGLEAALRAMLEGMDETRERAPESSGSRLDSSSNESEGRNAIGERRATNPAGSPFPDEGLLDLPEVRFGQCGATDLVLVIDDTGSMGGAIESVKSGLRAIVDTALTASGNDLRLGLVTFKDDVTVLHAMTDDLDAVMVSIDALTATGGEGDPEASDEAKNTVVNNLPAGERLDSNGAPGMQHGDFSTPYRPSARKIVILVTDAEPGGFDDWEHPADRDAMHVHALSAKEKGIQVSDVFVPSFGDYADQARLLEDDALTSGGFFVTTDEDGSGVGAAVYGIVAKCGTPLFADAQSIPAVSGLWLPVLASVLAGLGLKAGGESGVG